MGVGGEDEDLPSCPTATATSARTKSEVAPTLSCQIKGSMTSFLSSGANKLKSQQWGRSEDMSIGQQAPGRPLSPKEGTFLPEMRVIKTTGCRKEDLRLSLPQSLCEAPLTCESHRKGANGRLLFPGQGTPGSCVRTRGLLHTQVAMKIACRRAGTQSITRGTAGR